MIRPLEQQRSIIWLALFHLLVIICSNYLVQLPISVFGFTTTWGTFIFPLTLIATDVTVRALGAASARRIIIVVTIPSLIISYCISSLFYQGIWQGFVKLGTFNLFVTRICCASLIAYTFSQILDIYLFNYLRQNSRWWIALSAAIIFGNASDSLAFFFIAFYHSSDLFMAEHWIELAIVDYSFKLLISLILFIPIYNMLLSLLL